MFEFIKKLLGRGDGPIDESADVRACHEKFGILVSDEPSHLTMRKLRERIDFLQEELNEFKGACEGQDLAKQFDALLDMVYVAKGTGVMLGLPWSDGWREVQRANMSKVRGVGPRGHKVDLVKPVGWIAPRIEHVLERAGYAFETWTHPTRPDAVFEGVCRDDEEAA